MSNEKLHSRRSALKYLGVSSAGVALANAALVGKKKIKAGSDDAKQEIDQLKKSFEELDAKTKFIMRIILFLTGLDFFL